MVPQIRQEISIQSCLQRKTPRAEVLFLGVSGLRKCQRVGSDHLQWDVASATGIGTVRTDAFGIYDIVEFQ